MHQTTENSKLSKIKRSLSRVSFSLEVLKHDDKSGSVSTGGIKKNGASSSQDDVSNYNKFEDDHLYIVEDDRSSSDFSGESEDDKSVVGRNTVRFC